MRRLHRIFPQIRFDPQQWFCDCHISGYIFQLEQLVAGIVVGVGSDAARGGRTRGASLVIVVHRTRAVATIVTVRVARMGRVRRVRRWRLRLRRQLHRHQAWLGGEIQPRDHEYAQDKTPYSIDFLTIYGCLVQVGVASSSIRNRTLPSLLAGDKRGSYLRHRKRDFRSRVIRATPFLTRPFVARHRCAVRLAFGQAEPGAGVPQAALLSPRRDR